MNIPFLDLKAQYRSIKPEITTALNEVLDSAAYVLGKPVAQFETEFAGAHSVKHCVGTSSGTDGNHLALWALGIGPGDEVIIPANTFIATAWGATLCGATPVFVDCHPQSYNLDPTKLAKAITKKTKAIVPVHLYGQAADIDGVKGNLAIGNFKEKVPGEFVNEKTGQVIYLVEDCAQAHIAEYKGKKVGGLGRIASFSFYPGKNLGAYGEGGAVTTNADELAGKVRMIRDHGAVHKYDHEIYGHNYRMEGIQGAVLGVKLPHLSGWTDKRRSVASKYRERLKGVRQIVLPTEMPYAKHVYHLFVIQVAGGKSEERDRLMKHLNDKGVSTGLHYPIPLHQQKCFAHLGYKHGDFPATERLSESGLSLPMFPEMTDEQIGYVCDSIKSFYD